MPHQHRAPPQQASRDKQETAAATEFQHDAFFPTSDQLMQSFPMPQYGEMNPHAAAAAFGMYHNPAMFHPNVLSGWQAAAQANANNTEIADKNNIEGDDSELLDVTTEKSKEQSEESNASESKEQSSSKRFNKGSHESDEEAAATALLMAGGTRSENIESMQAAVRNKKQLLMKKVKADKELERRKSISSGGKGGGSSRGYERESRLQERQSSEQRRSESSGREKMPSRQNSNLSNTSNNSSSNFVLHNFPNVLHHVLSKSEFAGSALEWMSHGKSWRVLRWDDLAESVVPAYFPELCVSRSSSSGSNRERKRSTITDRMNMFIRQIKYWGFKEVREVGPDLGSFQHEFFIKIAPNLCRHMNAVSKKGSKRSADSANIVSPPRRSQKIHHMSMQPTHPSFHPGFMNTPEVFKQKASRTTSDSSKNHAYTENREDSTADVTSPERNGPRCVSFQERLDGDDSNGSSQRHQLYESPRSIPDIQLNFVSPSSQIEPNKHGQHVGVRSNRGGSRALRVVERDESNGSPTQSRSGFSVSNRGRGYRHISSRGRSSKSGSTRGDKERDSQQDVNDEEPVIIKALGKKEDRKNDEVPVIIKALIEKAEHSEHTVNAESEEI